MAPTPDDIEATVLRARAEAEAAAILGRAEVEARVVRASADADATAVRDRAEVEAAAIRGAAAADREEARLVLEEARRRADRMIAEAADARHRAEQRTLDRLLATRADLHDAIERLTEMSEPVLDLTDGGLALADASAVEHDLVSLGEALQERVTEPDDAGTEGPGETPVDPVDALVRSAIGHAVDSASTPGRAQPFATEQPARRRKQLRDGRNVL